ncbi:MAG TPA: hypothetical protein VGR02_15350 [Thermoanaerobaculia bacterium]|nr:hypothetical protein [Thermoanaerobaculia bacterium]
MFSTLLDKLTNIFSKYLLISAFFPLLIAAFVNAALLFTTVGSFHAWALKKQGNEPLAGALNGTVVLIALAVLAVILSSIATFLRELLEGKHWPAPLCKLLRPLQWERLETIDEKLDAAQREQWKLRHAGDWESQLAAARQKGVAAKGGCTYQGILTPLEKDRRQGELLPFTDLNAARLTLIAALGAQNVDAGNADAEQLNRDQVAFVSLVDYARTRADAEAADWYNRREADFGAGAVAPTTIGNIANALSVYGVKRYGFSLDVLWGRMQKTLAKEADFYPVVQDAKARLDGMIALFWLMLLTTAGWLPALALMGRALLLYLALAAAGPLLCLLLLRLAVLNYRGFADTVRTSVDLNRFQLLGAYHLPLPLTPVEEQKLWRKVVRHVAYGETPAVQYEHGK